MAGSTASSTTRAARLSPEDRRAQILETAATLVRQAGHTQITLKQVAAEAGVSTPLIYKYFPKREDLIIALLDHELARFQGRGFPKSAADVGEAAGNAIEHTLRYYDERGPVLTLLAADPVVEDRARQSNRASRASTTEYFIEQCVKAYGVPEDVATIAVTMVVNAPIHSMRFLGKQDIPVERTAEVWRRFIEGGWRALQSSYGEKR